MRWPSSVFGGKNSTEKTGRWLAKSSSMRMVDDGRPLTLDHMQSDSQSDFVIELDRVGKKFGRSIVLEDVNLQVPRGQTTVLLGPSGAGKTVTMNHIVGLLHP